MATAKQGRKGGSSPRAGSLALLDPAAAPKDGTIILAACGWPWLVAAMWDAENEQWAVANSGCEMIDGKLHTYWESDHERAANLTGWMPMPELPGGYVFSPENVNMEALNA